MVDGAERDYATEMVTQSRKRRERWQRYLDKIGKEAKKEREQAAAKKTRKSNGKRVRGDARRHKE